MTFKAVQTVWDKFPRLSDRPELQYVEVMHGVAVSTNGYVIAMESVTLPDGIYRHFDAVKIGYREYPNFWDKCISIISDTKGMKDVSEPIIGYLRPDRVKLNDVIIDRRFWDLMTGDIMTVKANDKRKHAIIATSTGVFYIAGVIE